MYIFVYGSLKNGFENHGWLEDIGYYIGNGITKNAEFKMYSVDDRYPAITQGNEKISGELYRIDDDNIIYIDYLEGYPNYYDRKEFLIDFNGKLVKAYIYYIKNIKDVFGEELPLESKRIKRENNIATWEK